MHTKIIAHRGYQKHYPENSWIALFQAIEAGAHYLEVDIQVSADGVPVLYHDRHMRRISGCEGVIHHKTYGELIHTPAHEPGRLGEYFSDHMVTPLVSLTNLLLNHPHVHAFVEIKRGTLHLHGNNKVLRCISEVLAPVIDRCTIMSFDLPCMHAARLAGWPSVGVVLESWDELNEPQIQDIRPDVVFCEINKLPREGGIALPNTKLAVYDIHSPDAARILFIRGADFVETFCVGEMITALRDANQKTNAFI